MCTEPTGKQERVCGSNFPPAHEKNVHKTRARFLAQGCLHLALFPRSSPPSSSSSPPPSPPSLDPDVSGPSPLSSDEPPPSRLAPLLLLLLLLLLPVPLLRRRRPRLLIQLAPRFNPSAALLSLSEPSEAASCGWAPGEETAYRWLLKAAHSPKGDWSH